MTNKDITDLLALISRANIQVAEAERVVELKNLLKGQLKQEEEKAD